MYRAQLIYWVNISAIATLLLISDKDLYRLAGIVVLVVAAVVLKIIQRAFERQGAAVALSRIWQLAANDQEAHQDD